MGIANQNNRLLITRSPHFLKPLTTSSKQKPLGYCPPLGGRITVKSGSTTRVFESKEELGNITDSIDTPKIESGLEKILQPVRTFDDDALIVASDWLSCCGASFKALMKRWIVHSIELERYMILYR